LLSWAAEVSYNSDDGNLDAFLVKLRTALSLSKRCSDVGIDKFQVEIATRSYEATPGHKAGRVFSIDSQESWDIAIPCLLKGERESLSVS
jgi:hypothetical protein